MKKVSNLVLCIVHGMLSFSLSEKKYFQKNVKMDMLLLILYLNLRINFDQFWKFKYFRVNYFTDLNIQTYVKL